MNLFTPKIARRFFWISVGLFLFDVAMLVNELGENGVTLIAWTWVVLLVWLVYEVYDFLREYHRVRRTCEKGKP
jgi:hypothetical protein